MWSSAYSRETEERERLRLRRLRGAGASPRAEAMVLTWRQPESGEPPAAYLAALLPGLKVPTGPRHLRLWAWFQALTPGEKPAARIEIYPRGGAKSTMAEQGITFAALTRRRHFALYVCGTQDQADAHLATVAALLERAGVRRAVNAYGQSMGWTGQLLRAAHGFNMLSVGLDGNVRGAKLDELRPDLIILDDVDGRHDSPDVVAKKLATITETILPAGSADAAVLFIQNLIHKDSVIAQLADGRARALLNRTVVQEPAVVGLAVEERQRDDGTSFYVITAGEATWPEGQSLETCEAQINEWGPSAFRRESQHEVAAVAGGVYSHLRFRRCRAAEVPDLVRVVVWCDPAVTKTDHSDCNGIQADGVAADGTIYRLWSWEQRATPLETMLRALAKAVELRAEAVGVETDQGGETWLSVYGEAWHLLTVDGEHALPVADELAPLLAALRGVVADRLAELRAGDPMATTAQLRPRFRSARAGSGHGTKTARAQRQVAAYERGRIVHVVGTHETLEAALTRFPHKPLDLADASYWAWDDLTGGAAVHDLLGHYRQAAAALEPPEEGPADG